MKYFNCIATYFLDLLGYTVFVKYTVILIRHHVTRVGTVFGISGIIRYLIRLLGSGIHGVCLSPSLSLCPSTRFRNFLSESLVRVYNQFSRQKIIKFDWLFNSYFFQYFIQLIIFDFSSTATRKFWISFLVGRWSIPQKWMLNTIF